MLNKLKSCALAVAVLGGAPTAVISLAQAQQQVLELDRIVAVVNNDVITAYELDTRTKNIEQQLKRQNTPLPAADALRKQVLERMIVDRAQLQLASDTGIRVDNLQLEQAVLRIAASNKMSLEEFKKSLAKDGLSFEQFKKELRNEIMLARLREREVENALVISDNEVDYFLSKQQTNANGSMEYHVAHILFRGSENMTTEQRVKLKQKAEQVVKRLQAGENFAKLAAAFSDSPDAIQGGDLGWRAPDRLPSAFVSVVEGLQPGGVSAILESPNGFHLVKLLEERGMKAIPNKVTQTHARHILIKTNQLVAESEARHKLQLLRDRLQNGASFAELARLYSQDGSAPKGGDLGWLYPGDTVPEFERAMDELKPGVVSQPITSPFGVHLIEVLERKELPVSEERKRNAARIAMRERKLEEAYDDWLRQLRDRTYVEYRLEEK